MQAFKESDWYTAPLMSTAVKVGPIGATGHKLLIDWITGGVGAAGIAALVLGSTLLRRATRPRLTIFLPASFLFRLFGDHLRRIRRHS